MRNGLSLSNELLLLETKDIFESLAKSKELKRYPVEEAYIKAVGSVEPEETFGYLKEAYDNRPKSILSYLDGVRYPPFKPSHEKKGETKPMKIKSVTFNDRATIVFWDDDTKTVVKLRNGEKYDAEKALAMAIAKKCLGGRKCLIEAFNTADLVDPKYTWKDISHKVCNDLPKLYAFRDLIYNSILGFGYISINRLVDLADEVGVFNEPVTLPKRSDMYVLGWRNEEDFGVSVDKGKPHLYIRRSPQPIKLRSDDTLVNSDG